MIVLWLVDLREVYESIGARSEVTQLEGIIFPNQHVLDLDVLMIAPSLMDKLQSFQDREGDLKKLLLCESFILSFLEQVKQSAVGTVLHQNNKHLIFRISTSNGDQISTITGD